MFFNDDLEYGENKGQKDHSHSILKQVQLIWTYFCLVFFLLLFEQECIFLFASYYCLLLLSARLFQNHLDSSEPHNNLGGQQNLSLGANVPMRNLELSFLLNATQLVAEPWVLVWHIFSTFLSRISIHKWSAHFPHETCHSPSSFLHSTPLTLDLFFPTNSILCSRPCLFC